MGRCGLILMLLACSAWADLTHFPIVFSTTSPGMLGGRPTNPGEYPGVVHLVFYDGNRREVSPIVGKCSGILIGACVLTARHCLEVASLHIVARSETGKESEIDRSTIENLTAISKKEMSFAGQDIAIAKLKTPLPHSYSSDIISSGFSPENKPFPSDISPEDFKKLVEGALIAYLVGVGEENTEKNTEEAMQIFNGNERTAATLGRRFGRRFTILEPRKKEGTTRLLGTFGEVLYSKELALQAESQKKIDAMNIAERWWQQKSIEDFEKAKNDLKDLLKMLSTLLLVKEDAQALGGDSGSPLFVDIGGKRVLIAIMSAIMAEEASKHPLIPDRHKQYAKVLENAGTMFASPVAPQYVRLMEMLKSLNCEESPKGSPDSIKAVEVGNR